LHHQLLTALHASPVGGHSGIPVTLRRAKQLFAWRGMNSSVRAFVSSCQVCQQAKPDRSRLPGLLQPLAVPDRAWKVLSMDFIEGLPLSGRFNTIFVVVDLFSKYAHFIGLKHPFTAASVASLFMQQVYRLHGMPSAIVSDRDRIFTSKLWSELFNLAHVDLRMSTAYHPQSDGQTERVNQCLETFLCCYIHACPTK
jgi:transposase InsO family protein